MHFLTLHLKKVIVTSSSILLDYIKIPFLPFFLGILVGLCYAVIPGSIQAQQFIINNTGNGSSLVPNINATSPNQTVAVNLLDASKYKWKTVNDADVLQRNGKLILIVETDKENKTYNRAFLQSQLNFTMTAEPSITSSQIYSFKSLNGNATVALEVRDTENNSILATHELSKNSTTAKFPLPDNIINKPIEFRLYIITDGPGFHVLSMKEFEILEDQRGIGEIKNVTKQQPKADEGAWNSYKQKLVFDEGGIPYYNYSYFGDLYIGLQRYPITIEHEALRLYDEYQRSIGPKNESAKQYFINNADWLVDNPTIKQQNASFPYAIYEHTFTWPPYKLEPPWQSGMAQGRALIVMVKAHELTGEQKYLESAKMLLNSFFVEIGDGGVTSKSKDNGWWYEEYASTDTSAVKDSRVLNGMMFALLGINEYYNYTHDPDARVVFDQGILALKNDLPKYDKNGVSLYDALGTASGEEYHNLHITQLKQTL